MIGPLFRAPKRGPRSEPLQFGTRRQAKNLLADLFELAVAPLARWEHETLSVETVEFTIRDLPAAFDGYRIAFLTDFHHSAIVPRWWLERAVRRALELAPDLIALGGDFLDDDLHYLATLPEVLAPLHAPDGVYGVLGNHDHYVSASGVRAALAHAGVRELLNDHVVIRRGEAMLAVGGLGDLECEVVDFGRVFAGAGPTVPRIAIEHDPDTFAFWPDGVRLDLMLCGHTHGGQAFLPLLGPPFVPSQFGFRYLAGRYQEGGRQLYVSRGIGAGGVPVRWKCPPELTLAVLRQRHS